MTEKASCSIKIPSGPSRILTGVMSQLASERTKGDDCIRIYGVRRILKQKLEGKNTREICQRLGISYKNFTNWVGYGNIDIGMPIPVFIKFCDLLKLDPDSFLEVARFGCTNSKKYKLPNRITPKFAYLLGYMMGDGHLANPEDSVGNGSLYNSEIRITNGTVKELLVLNEIFLEIFGVPMRIYQEGTFYRLIGRMKIPHMFLSRVLHFPTGDKKEKTRFLPDVYANNELKCWFFIGFFDADGCVCRTFRGKNQYWNVRLKQFNREILLQCLEIIEGRGIAASGPYRDAGVRNGVKTKAYVIAIQRRCEAAKFFKEFPSLKVMSARCSALKMTK